MAAYGPLLGRSKRRLSGARRYAETPACSSVGRGPVGIKPLTCMSLKSLHRFYVAMTLPGTWLEISLHAADSSQMSRQVDLRRGGCSDRTTALLLKADIDPSRGDVGFVPKAGLGLLAPTETGPRVSSRGRHQRRSNVSWRSASHKALSTNCPTSTPE